MPQAVEAWVPDNAEFWVEETVAAAAPDLQIAAPGSNRLVSILGVEARCDLDNQALTFEEDGTQVGGDIPIGAEAIVIDYKHPGKLHTPGARVNIKVATAGATGGRIKAWGFILPVESNAARSALATDNT